MTNAFSYFFVNVSTQLGDWFVRLMFFWLIQGPKAYWKKALTLSLAFEDTWATLITLRNLFAPLYQDYSLIGRLIGPFFRLGRFAVGIFMHLALLAVETSVFIIFCLVFWGAPLFFVINLFIWNQ